MLPMQGAQLCSLIGDLRSHMPCRADKKVFFFKSIEIGLLKKKIIGIDFLWCSVDISPPEREGISFVGKLYFGG